MSKARVCAISLLVALTVWPHSLPAQAKESGPLVWPGQTEGDFLIKDFRFHSGETLPELRLHYVSLGTPHRNSSREIDNAVLLLHVTGGDGGDFLTPSFSKPLFGVSQPLDVSKFYVIIPDSIGHGKSSKPSDGLRAHFPHYDYEDMVVAQHRLVAERLGVGHLELVMGFSMGGMQAWLWGERYPDMMDGLLPFGALPVEIAGRNRLTRRIVIEAIRHDPEWNNGDYEQQPPLAARLAPLIAMMIGNPVTQYERYPTRAAADAWYEQIVQRASTTDTNDKLYYYDASSDYNPSPDLEKVRAKLLLILFADDQVNSPAFGVLEREMPRVANGRYVIIPAGKQSNGELNNFNVELWRSYLEGFLRSLHH